MSEENIEKTEAEGEKPHKYKKSFIAKLVFAIIFVVGGNLLFFLMLWIRNKYDDVQFDQILYQLKSPVAGTNGDIVSSAMFDVVFTGCLVAFAEIFTVFFLSGSLKKLYIRFAFYAKLSTTKVAHFLKKHFMPLASLVLVFSIVGCIFGMNIHVFAYNLFKESDFIEENYADPEKVTVEFPEEKRNLIYIFLESMENTFSDPSAGGKVTDNFIPELTELANNNLSFKGPSGKGGAYSYVGTRWTAAALFAQTSGMIIKVPIDFNQYGDDGEYMPGITTLGDILAKEGYEQSVLFGSDGKFAARDVYFKEHGNYNVIDIYAIKNGGHGEKLPEDYWEWWGFEDAKLFEYAKVELTRLASLDKPFNFTTLTADTHFPDGYVCEKCPDKYEEQYANVLSCSSKQVYEFVEWIKAQDFYENTTIIISGDHLTMDPKFLAEIDPEYVRTSYNCIINPAPNVAPAREYREFGTFDMFPTTLAAMGVKIQGDRLGLGTNLFANVDTLTEKYGFDSLDDKLWESSDFYMDKFFEKPKSKK